VSSVLPEDVVVERAIKAVEAVGGVKLQWVDGELEEQE
jgi:hypothetical protein